MVTDLQTKVEKYETKAAQCEQSARQAPDEPERAFYQELANYYGAVATDFRHVIEKTEGRVVHAFACARSDCLWRFPG